MSAGESEQKPSPEQLQVSALTDAARSALDYQGPPIVSHEDGSSSRSFEGGNKGVICGLDEITSPDGAKTYMFRWPGVVLTPSGPSAPVGIEANWLEGGEEVNQRIVSGEVTEFEAFKPGAVAKIIELHLGGRQETQEGKLAGFRKKIGRLLTRKTRDDSN
jgi:hypothetical protein